MARSKSSQRWLKEHFKDPYVQAAQAQGLRSRAAFKLADIDAKERLLQGVKVVVDLGAAPGGWSEYVASKNTSIAVFALDILPIDPIKGVTAITGDFTEDEPLQALRDALAERPVDLVLSDMAPNFSGVATVDITRAMYLVELAHDFAREQLRPGGDLLMKVFQGEGFDALLKALRADFQRVKVVKPAASRSRSRETYLLASGLRL